MIDQLAYKIPLVHYTDQLTINIIYLLQMQFYSSFMFHDVGELGKNLSPSKLRSN
jgi:hypothetical protein